MNDMLQGVLAIVVPVLATMIGRALVALLREAEARTANAWIQRIEREAQEVVLAVSQTYSDALKAAAADGKLTAEECATAKAQALALLRDRLVNIPAALLAGDKLGTAIEAAVLDTLVHSRPRPAPVAESSSTQTG